MSAERKCRCTRRRHRLLRACCRCSAWGKRGMPDIRTHVRNIEATLDGLRRGKAA